MKAVLLLAALFSGQSVCPPGVNCPRPAQQQFVQPALPSPQAPASAISNVHLIKYDGVEFYVKGIKNGNVVDVDWSDAANLKSYWNAVAEKKSAEPKTGAVGDPTEGTIGATLNFGLDTSKIQLKGQPVYTASSEKGFVYAEQVHAESANPGLHVTVIGPKEVRQPVIEDMKSHPVLAGLTKDAQVQDYDPGSWAIDPSLEFPADGNPTIIAQTAKSPGDPRGGKVVYSNKIYPGPDRLAEDLRKADPTYKPMPNLADTELPFGLTPNQIGAAVVGGLCALIPSKRKGG